MRFEVETRDGALHTADEKQPRDRSPPRIRATRMAVDPLRRY